MGARRLVFVFRMLGHRCMHQRHLLAGGLRTLLTAIVMVIFKLRGVSRLLPRNRRRERSAFLYKTAGINQRLGDLTRIVLL